MNIAIYKSSLKRSRNFLLGTAVCAVGLILCFAALFPSVASGNSLADLLKTLPSGMLNAIGMKGDIRNFNDYLNMNFYNSVYLYLLMVYVILFSSSLIAKPMEDTSLAFYLNSPVSRKKYFYSQTIVFATGFVGICFLSVVSGIASAKIFAGGNPFSAAEFLKDNAMAGCIFLSLGSLCLLFSAVSKKSGDAVMYSSVVILTEYFLDMFVRVSSRVSWLKFFTVFTLFHTDRIKDATVSFGLECGILIAVSLVITAGAAEFFKRRDLYL